MYSSPFSLLYLLALSIASHGAIARTTWESIHQTLHTYPLAIDSKDFGLLSEVFTPTAFANYTGPLSNLTGLPAIQSGLAASVAKVTSQHLLGTTLIDIHPDETTANSTTYLQASLFGNPYSVGSAVYLYGYYADVLERSRVVGGEEGTGWRISRRQLVFLGPGSVGNLSLVGM